MLRGTDPMPATKTSPVVGIETARSCPAGRSLRQIVFVAQAVVEGELRSYAPGILAKKKRRVWRRPG